MPSISLGFHYVTGVCCGGDDGGGDGSALEACGEGSPVEA